MAKLIVRHSDIEQQFDLGDRTSIGRVAENDICLNDTSISRRHAEIFRHDERFWIRDLQSSNGTYLKDARVSEVELASGDELRLGKLRMSFIEEIVDQAPASNVRIISQPLSSGAVQSRIDMDQGHDFMPAYLIREDMDWRDDYEKMRLGYELLKHVQLNRNIAETLEKIAHQFLDIFPADRCAVVVLDRESEQLVPMAIRAKPGIDLQMSIPGSILDEVQQNHTSLLVVDSSSDERFSHSASIVVQGLNAIMCAPIICNNRFYGAIYLDTQKPAMVFSRKDLQLLSSLTAHVATVIANSLLLQTVEQEARDKAQLERLLPPAVIEKVTAGEVRIDKKGGELQEATILFADIRGFTNMAHYAPATKVVEMLNEYFELIVSIVFQYGGTVDKFIGDEVMVLFGAITDVEYPEDRAVRCAFHMHGALDMFNQQRKAEGKKVIEIGIGINTGEVVVGAIGSNQAMQYTCIGDAVNVASRLTTLAKSRQTIISDSTYRKLKVKPKHEQLPSISLKGIDRPIQMYSVWEQITDTTRRDV